jgi:hypothetical protein
VGTSIKTVPIKVKPRVVPLASVASVAPIVPVVPGAPAAPAVSDTLSPNSLMVLNDDTLRAVLDNCDYPTLMSLSMTNKRLRDLINQKFSQEASFAATFLKHTPEDEKLFIEKLYHLNFYQNADPRGIRIDNVIISHNPLRINSTWTKHNNLIRNDDLWYIGPDEHRYGRPAKTHYSSSGEVESRMWYRNGQLHRVGGPAIITYNKKGQIRRKEWYQNGNPILVERLRK